MRPWWHAVTDRRCRRATSAAGAAVVRTVDHAAAPRRDLGRSRRATPWPAPVAAGPVRGRVAVPGSKSVTNRALLLAALSGGPATVTGAPPTRDTALMVDALRALGVPITVDGERVAVARFDTLRGGGAVDCGLAGTVMRFVPPAAALADGPVRFDGDPRARERPMNTVLDALRILGARIDVPPARRIVAAGVAVHPPRHRRPARRRGRDRRVGVVAVRLRPAAVRRPLRQGRDGGPRRQAGAVAAAHRHVRRDAAGRGRGRRRRGGRTPGGSLRAPVAARDWTVEPDLSNAAVFLAAAAVTGGEVTVAGWPERSTQPGAEILPVLERFGATVVADPAGMTVRGPATCGASTSTCTTSAS